MKKVILLGLLAVSSYHLKAQTINGIPIKDINVEYLEIENRGYRNIYFDFGQAVKAKVDTVKRTVENDIIKDADGKVLNFHSGIDALNFISKNGFELVTAYATQFGTSSTIHYLMINKKLKTKDIKD